MSAAGSVASRNLCPCFLPNAIQRLVEGICTAPEPLAFFVRHVRLEHLDHAAAADDARQGQRDSKLLLIAADRNDRAFVIEHHLGDAGRYDADSVLASIMALDDADVGVAHVFLQLLTPLSYAPRQAARRASRALPPLELRRSLPRTTGTPARSRGRQSPVLRHARDPHQNACRGERETAGCLDRYLCSTPLRRDTPRARYRRADRADRRRREAPRWAPPPRPSGRYRDRLRRFCRAASGGPAGRC